MKLRHFALLLAVFLIQASFGVGYFVYEADKNAFAIAYTLIPIAGYLMVVYRLAVFRNIPRVPRAVVAVALSGVLWYVSGLLITVAVIRLGLVKPR
jgi:hypothetical protein